MVTPFSCQMFPKKSTTTGKIRGSDCTNSHVDILGKIGIEMNASRLPTLTTYSCIDFGNIKAPLVGNSNLNIEDISGQVCRTKHKNPLSKDSCKSYCFLTVFGARFDDDSEKTLMGRFTYRCLSIRHTFRNTMCQIA